jgi:hypothetical protein
MLGRWCFPFALASLCIEPATVESFVGPHRVTGKQAPANRRLNPLRPVPLSFRTEPANAFSFTFAPANVSACAQREISLRLFLDAQPLLPYTECN